MRVYGKHFLDLDTEERNRIKAATHAYAYGMSWEEYQRLRNPDKEGSNGSQ